MPTTTIKLTGYSTVVLTYTLTNYSDDLYQVHVTNVKFTNSRSGGTTLKCWLRVQFYAENDLVSRYFADGNFNPASITLAKGTKSKSTAISSGGLWVRMSKQHAAVSGSVKLWVDMTASDGGYWEKYPAVSVTLPAKTSYPVTYDAAGGAGAPGNQTKWYGENLVLQDDEPTRLGYAFDRWNTAADGTGADWMPGATYGTNAALSLHAIWNFTPRITAMKAYRCDSSGNQDDNGTYAWVEAVWECDGAKSGNSGTVTATITNGSTEVPVTVGGDSTGTGGTMTALIPNVDVDTQYTIAVTVTDALGSVTRGAILTTSHFTMDSYRGGTGFGIGCAAPPSGFAIGYDVDLRAGVACAGRAALPTYLYDAQPALADVPRVPCLVVLEAGALYLYTSGGITQL